MRALLILCSLWLCTGCNLLGKSIPGSGVIKRESCEVGQFNKISFAGAADIQVVAGAEQVGCEIECDDNLLQYVTTEVVGDELRIRLNDASRISPTEGLKVAIQVPELSRVELAGGTTTSISGLNNQSMKLELAGSHDVSCEGQVERVDWAAAGACKILASKLQAKTVTIELAGSCSAEVEASEKLDVSIAGSGSVKYRGDAKVSQKIAGSGSIEKL